MNTKAMKTLFARLAVGCTVAFGCPPAVQSAPAQTPTTTAPSDAKTPDPELEALQKRFQRLFNSLQAKGSVSEGDNKYITELADALAEYSRTHPKSRKALAMQAELAKILKDDDRVFELFDKLMMLDQSNVQLAQDWLTYFQMSDNPERADDVIDRIIEIGPDSDALRRTAAEHLRTTMQYDRVIDFVNQIELDPENNPAAIMMLSDALFAEHRFQESLDTMNLITQEVMDRDASVASQVNQKKTDREEYINLWAKEQEIRSSETAADYLPRVEIITSKGRIVAELFENEAPNTVANFIVLAEKDFYNGTSFHRVLANFMAQGGDPLSKEGATGVPGTGGPGYYIPDEHDREDHRNHFSGSLSMAKTAAPNTAGSGFYITFEPTPWLNGRHTVFGTVTEGLDVVRKIQQDDRILEVNVLRKRPHEYKVQKLPLPGQTLPAEEDSAGNFNADEEATDDLNGDAAPTEGADNAGEETGDAETPE